MLPTGVVVGIVRRAWKPLCGALLPSLLRTGQAGTSATSALFAPADRRLPRVRIRTRQAAALRGQRIVVAIDRWPRSSRYPLGHYVRTLGPLGDAQTETEALLLQHDIPHHPGVFFFLFFFFFFCDTVVRLLCVCLCVCRNVDFQPKYWSVCRRRHGRWQWKIKSS